MTGRRTRATPEWLPHPSAISAQGFPSRPASGKQPFSPPSPRAGGVRRMDELLIPPTATPEALAGRDGFDEDFLGQHVPLPGLPGVGTVLLPYTHFSVLLRLDKR